MRLEGKVAIVTGGGTGLGAEITKRFIESGAKVVITGRRQEKLDALVSELPDGVVKACAGDITKEDDRRRIVETALEFGEGLDILVNNAGAPDDSTPFEDFSEEAWQAALDINLTAPMRLMQLSIPEMKKSGGGSIINIASVAALGIIPGSVGYCTTKRALVAMSQVVAVDHGAEGIRCNVVCPGSFMTDMTKYGLVNLSGGGDPSLAEKYFSDPIPQKRIADPHEIGGLIEFLASDDASYVNAAMIPIDGGASVVDVQAFSISTMQ